jgi:predicted methyltransferase
MDLRKSINFISDVVVNRPTPIRELDQIYMKHADMLLQVEHISKWFTNKSVVFIGDGDAIALSLAYLQKHHELDREDNKCEVTKIFVLDFDERIINSIKFFSKEHDLSNLIDAKLYNVADPLPQEYWHHFDCFYCNPPYGASNEGKSISAFMRRGFEATNQNSIGCIVMADDSDMLWTKAVLYHVQKEIIENGFLVREMIPEFHTYHLDDNPSLKSCSLVINRFQKITCEYNSLPLDQNELDNFYGSHSPLIYKCVQDETQHGKYYKCNNYKLIPLNKKEEMNYE